MTLKDMYLSLQHYEFNHECFFKRLKSLVDKYEYQNIHGVLSEYQITKANDIIDSLMRNEFETVSSKTLKFIQNEYDYNHELTLEEYTIYDYNRIQ